MSFPSAGPSARPAPFIHSAPSGSPPALSLLDLVAVREGKSVADAIQTAVRTAQHVESLGFTRYWLAEHHNMPGIASSATAVLVGHVAGHTRRIRVGSGGVMLPNHAPLVVAEAFGTLAEIYPGRIDLGLGRAPGTDGQTMRALRRNAMFEREDDFPRDVQALQRLLGAPQAGQAIVATPGANTHVPLYLLGSSLFSAQLAAHMGLPYAFASHFAPRFLDQALQLYRDQFQPSAVCARPYAIVGVPVMAASSDAQAHYLATSTYQRVLGILTNQRGLLPAPKEGFMESLDVRSRQAIEDFLALRIVGGPERVAQGFAQVQARTQADEFIIVSDFYDEQDRQQSLRIAAQALGLV